MSAALTLCMGTEALPGVSSMGSEESATPMDIETVWFLSSSSELVELSPNSGRWSGGMLENER